MLHSAIGVVVLLICINMDLATNLCRLIKYPEDFVPSTFTGIFFANLGRGPRAFQIGKISAVNHYFGKFSKQTRTAFLVSLKTKLAITHTIAIKLKENRMQF